ncbi:HAD-IIIA family hydrolase (plasmid) [Clostridium estertheticum]|uniref:HAD-IIIA family hydrolase n=1 Tax=Clostridium estertheticum TaxID=238834 RepID=UPI001C7D0098|nr:HAD-IIIA family hydrolase [Clostridium estertheticum]MBX4260322.1 HAD-IIIA family hydrolase [Clostridium estertheticum]WLC72786.1 HAD-IIIA family hydrolase [Clostridium estertheticum]
MRDIIEAVFIDRDGTIGGDCSITYPGEFKLYPFTDQEIKLLKSLNINVFAFTNQPGISRGESTTYEFEKAYICPNTNEERCSCRKPSSEMLIKASNEYDIDLTKCVVIGDRWSDMLAGAGVGTKNILVMTGAGNESLCKYRNKWADIEPNYIAKNVLDAVL